MGGSGTPAQNSYNKFCRIFGEITVLALSYLLVHWHLKESKTFRSRFWKNRSKFTISGSNSEWFPSPVMNNNYLLSSYLQVLASQAAIKASGLSPDSFSSVCIGNVLSASSADAPYLARHVALRCGLPIPTPALIGTAQRKLGA